MSFQIYMGSENVCFGFWVEGTACGLTGGWQSLGRTKQLPLLHATDLFTRAGLDCDDVLTTSCQLQISTVSLPF